MNIIQIGRINDVLDVVLQELQALGNPYHGVDHTLEVVRRCEVIVSHAVLPLEPDELEDLRIAAFFHDAGHAGVAERRTSIRTLPRLDLSNEEYAIEMLRHRLAGLLPQERIDRIALMILATTFGQNPHPRPAQTTAEKILVLADVAGFFKNFDGWATESLLVLAEAAPAALPPDYETWKHKNRKGFLNFYVRPLVDAVVPLVDVECGAHLVARLDATLAAIDTDLDRFKDRFETVRAARMAAQ